ncbi:MAG: hypothetical protein QXM86_04730 [Candidatus Bathyarchaeia archaeon]
MMEKYAYIMMAKEKWWHEFLRLRRGGKEFQSYVQRGHGPPKNATMLFFYVTKPVCEVAGYAEFVERKAGNAEDLWENTEKNQCCNPLNSIFDSPRM